MKWLATLVMAVTLSGSALACGQIDDPMPCKGQRFLLLYERRVLASTEHHFHWFATPKEALEFIYRDTHQYPIRLVESDFVWVAAQGEDGRWSFPDLDRKMKQTD